MKTSTLPLVVCLLLGGCASLPRETTEADPNRALILAAYRLQTEEVVRLLSAGADVNARFFKDDRSVFTNKCDEAWPQPSWTPLLAAVCAEDPEWQRHMVRRAAQEPGFFKARVRRIAGRAARKMDARRLAIARLLLEAGADVNADDGWGSTPLYVAASFERDDLAFLLLEYQPEVNTRTEIRLDPPAGYTPLHSALHSPRLVKALLDRGANPNAMASWGETPLTEALNEANTNVVAILQSYGAVLPKRGDAAASLFHRAVMMADRPNADLVRIEALFRMLIGAGADPNGKWSSSGEPVLPLAVTMISEPAPFVRLLVDAGADVNVPDRDGRTPLHFAAMFSRPAATAILVSAGADADARDGEGNTPLHMVSSIAVAKTLLAAGAAVTATNALGQTPAQKIAWWVVEPVDERELPADERKTYLENRAVVDLLMQAEAEQKAAAKSKR